MSSVPLTPERNLSHHRSTEGEARPILRACLAVAPEASAPGWVDAIRGLFELLGGPDLGGRISDGRNLQWCERRRSLPTA